MTPEQAAQFLELVEGDTGTTLPDSGGEPGATTADAGTTSTPDAERQPSTNNGEQPPPSAIEPDPANTVILAKGGKHTIPFAKLEEARREVQTARAAAQAALDELAAIRAQAEQRAAAGLTDDSADSR